MKYFMKKLLGHEIFRSMVYWVTKYFLKNLWNYPAPPSYIFNVHSLKDVDGFEELSLNSMYKRLNDFKKDLIGLKLLIHKQMKMKIYKRMF